MTQIDLLYSQGTGCSNAIQTVPTNKIGQFLFRKENNNNKMHKYTHKDVNFSYEN